MSRVGSQPSGLLQHRRDVAMLMAIFQDSLDELLTMDRRDETARDRVTDRVHTNLHKYASDASEEGRERRQYLFELATQWLAVVLYEEPTRKKRQECRYCPRCNCLFQLYLEAFRTPPTPKPKGFFLGGEARIVIPKSGDVFLADLGPRPLYYEAVASLAEAKRELSAA